MSDPSKKQLAHVLWIGGATDSGKSSVAQNIGKRHGMAVYHYDRADAEHHQILGETVPEMRRFSEASLEERWVNPEPAAMLEYLFISFPQRFRLVIESLLELPSDRPVIAEGFGFLPELVHPLLSSRHQAIWFVPTEKFKLESMARRGKPSFAATLSDPDRAKRNLFTRDMLLADYYRQQVSALGYTLHEADGSLTIEEQTELARVHFAHYLPELN